MLSEPPWNQNSRYRAILGVAFQWMKPEGLNNDHLVLSKFWDNLFGLNNA